MDSARKYVEECADMYGIPVSRLHNPNIDGGAVGYMIVDYPDAEGKSWILELGFADFEVQGDRLVNVAHNIVAQHRDHQWFLTHLGKPLQVIETLEVRLGEDHANDSTSNL